MLMDFASVQFSNFFIPMSLTSQLERIELHFISSQIVYALFHCGLQSIHSAAGTSRHLPVITRAHAQWNWPVMSKFLGFIARYYEGEVLVDWVREPLKRFQRVNEAVNSLKSFMNCCILNKMCISRERMEALHLALSV